MKSRRKKEGRKEGGVMESSTNGFRERKEREEE